MRERGFPSLTWDDIYELNTKGECHPQDLWETAVYQHSRGWFAPGVFYVYASVDQGGRLNAIPDQRAGAFWTPGDAQRTASLWLRRCENVWILHCFGGWNARAQSANGSQAVK